MTTPPPAEVGDSASTSSTAPTNWPPPGDAPELNSVHVKLPPFWPQDPEMWFAQAEALFATRRITSEVTKFHHIVASLAPEIATEVRDLLVAPPTTSPYSTLRAAMLERIAASEQRRLEQLLTAEELGDRKPSQLLRRLQQLIGTTQADTSLMRQLFLQRMPPHVRGELAMSDKVDLPMAYKMLEASPYPILATVCRPDPPASSPISAAALSDRMDTLDLQQPRSRARSASRRRDGGLRSRRSTPADDNVCFYHSRFGEAALRCGGPWCRFGSERPSGQETGNDADGRQMRLTTPAPQFRVARLCSLSETAPPDATTSWTRGRRSVWCHRPGPTSPHGGRPSLHCAPPTAPASPHTVNDQLLWTSAYVAGSSGFSS